MMNKKYIKLLFFTFIYISSAFSAAQFPLHKAAKTGSIKLTVMLAQGADINSLDKDGNTPLHIAAIHNRIKSLNWLLSHGAQINIKNKKGKTPLHYACDLFNYSCIKALVNAGADVTIQDNSKETPLHFMAHYHNRELITLLINCGAKIDAQDKYGNTPLHNAIYSLQYGIVPIEDLIQRGADIYIKNNGGETALDVAQRLDKKWIVNYLQEIDNIPTIKQPEE